MSRTAEIDFAFYGPLRPREVLASLQQADVRLSCRGVISYVVDVDKVFDWRQVDSAEMMDVLLEMDSADPDVTSLGVSIFLDDQETGGDLLFHPGHTEISFMAEINRRNLSADSKFCDFGWYLARFVPVFEPLGLVEVVARDAG